MCTYATFSLSLLLYTRTNKKLSIISGNKIFINSFFYEVTITTCIYFFRLGIMCLLKCSGRVVFFSYNKYIIKEKCKEYSASVVLYDIRKFVLENLLQICTDRFAIILYNLITSLGLIFVRRNSKRSPLCIVGQDDLDKQTDSRSCKYI